MFPTCSRVEAVHNILQLLLQGHGVLTFDQVPLRVRRLSRHKRFNLLKLGFQILSRSTKRYAFPPIVQIEPTNTCNLHCLTCATGAGLMTRPATFMPFALYRSIIAQVCQDACLLVFWSWGEPFLHPEACRMIRYAKDHGLLVHSSTNGHFFTTREQARQVVESGLDSLIVAVDGLDQQTYERYRQGGDLHRVLTSIRNLIAERQAAGVIHPRITFRFIVMQHNEHQVPHVRAFAESLGVDAVAFRSANVRRGNVDYTESLTPRSSEFQRELRDAAQPDQQKRCSRPDANLTIFSNGDVVICERDVNAEQAIGNVNTAPLHRLLYSTQSASQLHLFRRRQEQLSYCASCEHRRMLGRTANVTTATLHEE